MKTISLKIEDGIFKETEKILSITKKSRNRYINEALDCYNQLQKRILLEKSFKKESNLVKDESIAILKEFEEFEYNNDTI
jgi:predicted RNA-binding protein YlxR (DUF448 family)